VPPNPAAFQALWFSVGFETSKSPFDRTIHQHEGMETMHVSVNGVRLFFDVEGTKFVPEGPVMREKPTLLLLHGGPGADHSIYRPAYSALSDIVQIVYLDHRGNGRSEDGPQDLVQFERFADCRHAVIPDAPERAFAVIRDFIMRPK
jgi:pimeloyl-ACP methyl ester carboxylesterase